MGECHDTSGKYWKRLKYPVSSGGSDVFRRIVAWTNMGSVTGPYDGVVSWECPNSRRVPLAIAQLKAED